MKKSWARRVLGLTAALALSLSAAPALAVSTLPTVNAYGGFSDVAEGIWYYQGVRCCYETGLMTGTAQGTFTPDGTITLGETAAIAVRLGNAMNGLSTQAQKTSPWYQWYVDQLSALGATVSDPTRPATRQEFFDLLSAVVPRDRLSPINAITALPDTGDEDILAFYNAGILTGVDKYGTFNAGGTLSRAECAVMTARLADPALRKEFVPLAPEGSGSSAGGQTSASLGQGTALTVNGRPVPLDDFLSWVAQAAYDVDYRLYQQGTRLDWTADYGVGDMRQYILNSAVELAVFRAIAEAQAEELGCRVSELPARLVPDPGREDLNAYAQEQDLLCAKHILVPDTDTAQAVLDGLKATPTLDQFNALLTVFGTDPGMESNPDGYLFTAGEMVPEFEEATRGLAFGTYTAEPVQSDYGYHIIWRLDPADHPELLEEYQSHTLYQLTQEQAQNAQVTTNDALISSIDVPTVYQDFLASLNQG